ncbi:hypothetical protein AG1IA_10099 [Rhizoctonia solani AG-1 IA]|uniref:Uncharacterized protein n=1 Tax=Thanatephorus cucumeris (strain AG1-IA) TaxID=983506 RepID=L8WCI2_THACA|nr:hypothetical protein AG1IA_10099 [Rhizoctonia solani AG-1 IA]
MNPYGPPMATPTPQPIYRHSGAHMPNPSPYPYGKPKSKYWKRSWGDRGPKSGSKPYAGPRQGMKTRRGERI